MVDPVPIISDSDCKMMLSLLESSFEEFEYLTPVMFAALLDVSVNSYLRGKGLKIWGSRKRKKRLETLSLCLDNLQDFCLDNDGYVWFLEKLDRVQQVNEEQDILE